MKIYDIINFDTTRYKMTASGNIDLWIFNYKLLKPVNILRLPKDLKKQAKTANSKKKNEREK